MDHDPSNISSDENDQLTAGSEQLDKSRLIKVGSCIFLGVHRQLEVPGPKNLLQSQAFIKPHQPSDVKFP